MKALALLLLLPIDVLPGNSQDTSDPWTTTSTITVFSGNHANVSYASEWDGVAAGPVQVPQKLQNWSCTRGGKERVNEVTNYVECRHGDATIVIDVTCKTNETDADIGSVILLNRARDFGARFVMTCVTSHPPQNGKSKGKGKSPSIINGAGKGV